jgi:hypothetical protein
VPKVLRTQYGIEPGTTLDWRPEGDFIRVFKLSVPSAGGSFLPALCRLGRVAAAPRDQRPVQAS